MRLVFWIAVLLLPLAACGGSAESGGAPPVATATAAATPVPATAPATIIPPTPTSAPPTPTPVAPASTPAAQGGLPRTTITLADEDKTFHYRVGDTFGLALKAPDGFQNWEVTTPDPSILAPVVNPAAAAARGVTLRAFRAVAAGQTDLTASDRPACQSGQACPALVRAFKVTVVVDG